MALTPVRYRCRNAQGDFRPKMRIISVFVDTNAFIQLRDLKDIPWGKIYKDADRIDIHVPLPVIKELENFKTGTAARQRDRSRKALRDIDEAMDADDRALTLKEASPEVRLVVERTKVNWTDFPDLDQSCADDQIVALAAMHGSAVVFSHDRGPRITARHLQLSVLKPKEEWHLPAERSAHERKIQELEKKVNARYPSIKLTFSDIVQDDNVLEFPIPLLPPLGPDQVEERVAWYLGLNPRARFARSNFYDMVSGVSAEDITQYNKAYDLFVEETRRYFQILHEIMARMARIVPLQYQIENDSSVSAQGLRVEVGIPANGLIISEWAEARQSRSVAHPRPPERPRSLFSAPSFGMPSLDTIIQDPVAFFWRNDPESGAKKGALQCQDFRARRVYNDEIIVAIEPEAEQTEVQFNISATNTTDCLDHKVTIRLVEQQIGWDDPLVDNIIDRFSTADEEDDD